jgi:uncharacterized DUF497 family protein
MKITFDPVKPERCLAERGLDFRDARELFAGRHFHAPDDRRDYGEERIRSIGFLTGRMVMVVWTPRGEDRHVFSMRHCNDRERKIYKALF